MALRVKVSARAAAQIRVAAAWWAENRSAAPGAFRNDIEDALNLLAHQPEIGALCAGVKTKDVRRLLIGRIRYYRATSDALEVLAVWHVSRGRQPTV